MAELEHKDAAKLFRLPCDFVIGAATLDVIPESDLPEVAFVGRSNVGKSSLINALTGHKALARTSNTPGRTQQLNFFNLGEKLMLVDLPGYGYARVSKTDIARWTELMRAYLRGRQPLQRVCVLIDSRHGLKDSDREMMEMLDIHAVSYQLVLTKCDKVKPPALAKLIEATENEIKQRPAAHPKLVATSSVKATGLNDLQNELYEVMRSWN